MLSTAAWAALMAMVINAVKDQSPVVKLGVSVGGKLLGLVGDDIIANKLPEELKVRSRAFFDMLLITKDYDAAIVAGIDLITEIYELLKKPATPVLLP